MFGSFSAPRPYEDDGARLCARMNRLLRILFPVVAILCAATAVGCDWGERPYDTPRARVEGDQAVALLRREVERRGLSGTFPKAEKIETRTPFGIDAWLVRLFAEGEGADLCGYVWRGEEPETGRAEGTVIRVRFDARCRHWPDLRAARDPQLSRLLRAGPDPRCQLAGAPTDQPRFRGVCSGDNGLPRWNRLRRRRGGLHERIQLSLNHCVCAAPRARMHHGCITCSPAARVCSY